MKNLVSSLVNLASLHSYKSRWLGGQVRGKKDIYRDICNGSFVGFSRRNNVYTY